jgi:integrase
VHIPPTFERRPITDIAQADVRAWYSKLGTTTGPTARARAYALLRTVLGTAVGDELIPANPCRISGAGLAKRKVDVTPATLSELAAITAAMPDRLKLMVALGAWCALRFGELAELRRGDIDTAAGLVHIRRGAVQTKAGRLVKDPKSEAGKRTVAIPPHLMPAVRDHLRDHARPGADGLLFTNRWGDELPPSSLHKIFYPARAKAGRPDLRFHDLRHTGATLAAATGASLAELMARLGHSTPTAALRYQHASQARDRVIAEALSKLVTASAG